MDKMESKTKIDTAIIIKIVFYFVTIPILITTTTTCIGLAQMHRVNEDRFRYAREYAAEINETAGGLTRDEVIGTLGPSLGGQSVAGIPGTTRHPERHPDIYYMVYNIGWYYEWNSQGQNFRQEIRLVLVLDEEGETVVSTFMLRQVNSSHFVVMD